MDSRDEFSEVTKRTLRDRAGNKCSFPGCNSPTSGPSNESTSAVDSTGMACHIYAAAPGPGSRRYNQNMTAEQRRSPNNGIWMCYRHGKQIDNDEQRFKASTLFKWKEIAEKKAQIENELGKGIDVPHGSLSNIGLASQVIEIRALDGYENALIGNAFMFSGADVIWGERFSRYVSTYVIERVRNAFQHGKATFAKIFIDKHKVRLLDDGDDFSHKDLVRSNDGRGGQRSKSELLKTFSDKLVSVSRRVSGKNIHTLAPISPLLSVEQITPCSITIDYKVKYISEAKKETFTSCNEVYIRLPDHFAFSDISWLESVVPDTVSEIRKVVFVMSKVADYIPEEISERYRGCRVIVF